MKIRKRMGMPKTRIVLAFRGNRTRVPRIPQDVKSLADLDESTPVRFAERLASLSAGFTSATKREAAPTGK